MWNSSHNVGGAIIPLVVGICAQLFGWRFGMFIPGIMSIGIGFFLLFCLRDTPSSLGLPSIEKFRNDYPAGKAQEKDISVKDLLFKYVLNNSYIWLLAITYLFVYFIRGAIMNWSALFLMETRGYSPIAATASITWFELGGLVGSLAAGWASDTIFQGRRGPIMVLFSAGVIAALMGLWMMPGGYLIADYALIFAIGFLIFGPQMLIGIAATELSHKKAAGSATGFTGWIAYIGMAVAGYPLGKIMESSGWQGCFITLIGCGVMCVLLLLPIWSIKTNPKYLRNHEEEKLVEN
ncbi:MAG: MFS transporter [Rhabdochlamydiaceae bacterium]|jgi:OPA family sugar phosphate sensor protein UhpC-like MFS transporter